MSDNVENLILEHLRAMRMDISAIREDVREVKQRLTSLELSVSGLKRDHGQLYGDLAEQHTRYDRLTDRIERIERRLDIALPAG